MDKAYRNQKDWYKSYVRKQDGFENIRKVYIGIAESDTEVVGLSDKRCYTPLPRELSWLRIHRRRKKTADVFSHTYSYTAAKGVSRHEIQTVSTKFIGH